MCVWSFLDRRHTAVRVWMRPTGPAMFQQRTVCRRWSRVVGQRIHYRRVHTRKITEDEFADRTAEAVPGRHATQDEALMAAA